MCAVFAILIISVYILIATNNFMVQTYPWINVCNRRDVSSHHRKQFGENLRYTNLLNEVLVCTALCSMKQIHSCPEHSTGHIDGILPGLVLCQRLAVL